jgi:hypothetical protein
MTHDTEFSRYFRRGRCGAALVPVAGVLLLAGCGRGANLGTVKGTVTLDGKPLPSAVVSFRPVEGGRQSYGRTDANGHYELRYSEKEMGAVVGKHKVMLTTATGESSQARFQVDKVPPQYRNCYTTKLEKEVSRGANTVDLALSSR